MKLRRPALIDVLTGVSAICAILLTGMIAVDRFRGPAGPRIARAAPDRDIEHWAERTAMGYRFGPPSAKVAILEFGDYQCPACRSFHRVLKAVLKAYPEQVAVIYRHMPLPQHPAAYTAAKAVECAGLQNNFEPYHNWLYENDWLATSWRAIATDVGIPDLAAFDECLKGGSTQTRVENDLAASRSFSARATPAVLVNGTYLGARPDSARLFDLIERALRRSKPSSR